MSDGSPLTKSSSIAVGIKYVPHEPAPRILFKARGERVRIIRELAKKFGVEIQEEPVLSNLLYQLPENSWIPEEHFEVIARLLSFVYRRKEERS